MSELEKLNPEFVKSYRMLLLFLRFNFIDLMNQMSDMPYFKYLYLFMFSIYTIALVCHTSGILEKISEGANLLQLSGDLSAAVVILQGAILFVNIYFNKNKIKEFILRLGLEWRDDNNLRPELVMLKRKQLSAVYLFTFAFYTGLNIFVHSYMMIPLIYIMIKKFILKLEVSHTVPFYAKVPFNYENNFLLYLIVYMYDYGIMYNLGYLISADILLITVSMNNLRILFQLLRDDFKSIFNSLKNGNTPRSHGVIEKHLITTIRRHITLLELMQELSTAFNGIFAIHLIFVSGTICFFGFAAVFGGTLEDYKNFVASVIVIVYIFFCCLHGQRLADSGMDIATSVYDSAWYQLPTKYKKIILIILLRSQKTYYIKSTRFTEISLKTFTRMMNMTWTFFSVMKTIYKRS
uniref:Odorant receptor n=1 Tax=Eogystia hippophaecolus TaxID=1206364 RepID=A0A1B3P5Q7_EOGHI|nr:odorant receptor [Eogystia hippophaecolus]